MQQTRGRRPLGDPLRADGGRFQKTGEQLLQIASAMEELSATNNQVHENVTQIHTLTGEVAGPHDRFRRAHQRAGAGRPKASRNWCRFKIGRGAFDLRRQDAPICDAVQAQLEEMHAAAFDISTETTSPSGMPNRPNSRWSGAGIHPPLPAVPETC